VIPYRIDFENLGPGSRDANGDPYPTYATAPAQRVTISDQLEADLDWGSFRLTEIGFGDTIISIPAESTYYNGMMPMKHNGRTFDVELEAGINLATGQVFAIFQSINPITSLPPDVLTGFLPPEDGTGRGKGHISYTISPAAGLPSGTEIHNIAQISFDGQTIIATNQIDPQDASQGTDPAKEARNTLDANVPESHVLALPPSVAELAFPVEWSGQDDAGGSGIGGYDVFVSDNGGPFVLWLQGTKSTSTDYSGDWGHTYAFYSVAVDHVGHREEAPLDPDTQTTVVAGHPWQNSVDPLDASGDGRVVPLDVLIVINYLNEHGSGPLTVPPVPPNVPPPFYDVSGDDFVSPIDALLVINFLNRQGGAGGEAEAVQDVALGDFLEGLSPIAFGPVVKPSDAPNLGRSIRRDAAATWREDILPLLSASDTKSAWESRPDARWRLSQQPGELLDATELKFGSDLETLLELLADDMTREIDV